jgi:AcrR family transcriptional regulator
MDQKPAKEESKKRILGAAVDVLTSSGLTDWTVEKVASKAGCAKGLVLYHFDSKQALLDQVAADATAARWSARVTVLRLPPAKAIDRLWDDLSAEVASGRFRLWLSLAAAASTAAAASFSTSQRQQLATAAAATFRIPAGDPALTTLPAILDGFQLLLLQGVGQAEVREGFDSYWLELLERAA